jgi:UDP-N-acetyl-D-mannosaminuronic acid dehydrogenase
MYGDEPLESVLKRNLDKKTFIPTTSVAEAAAEASAFIVTVGIPVLPDGSMEPTGLIEAARDIGRVVKRGDLVLVRSTVVPGWMEEKVIPTLREASGMEPGRDFHVAYAAERVAEGRAMIEFQTLDIVLAGLTDRCTELAKELLGQLTSGTLHVTNLRIAQAVKVVENAQRDVNIALAQEIARFAEYHGVDVYELIRMANTHPRVKLLEPGIGVGGFCIPNAYPYMKASLKPGQTLPLFDLARTINQNVPTRIVDKLEEELRQIGKSLDGSTIAVLGLGMKDFSNDIRLSPALDLVAILQKRGAHVQAYDPTVPLQFPYQVDSLAACLQGADGIVVATWQREFETEELAKLLANHPATRAIIDIKHRLDPYLPVHDRSGGSVVHPA